MQKIYSLAKTPLLLLPKTGLLKENLPEQYGSGMQIMCFQN
jgi:hypothetical protein